MTANEIAAQLGVTHNAIRAHLSALQRDQFIVENGRRESGTRPAIVYSLAPGADAVLSRAYIPFVAQLLRVLGDEMSRPALDKLMETVGRRLATNWPRTRGNLGQRVEAASLLLGQLGAVTDIEKSGRGYVIRGHGCLLAEAVHGSPQVCRAMESLLGELLAAPVRECCERSEHPRCCFEIGSGRAVRAAPRSGRIR